MNTLQKRAVEIALSGHNLLLTGAGGTGKTFVMKHIIRNLKTSHKNVGVTASTGMASTCFAEFNATTLHRWCGLSFELENRNLEEIVQSIISRGNCENIVLANALVIDEISMISAKTFDLFEYICRKIRKNPNYFGGLQVLLSGSFTQLPPVANGRNQDNGQYCFESDIFKNSIPHHVHLTEMLRQKDHQLATLVQELETGCPSPKSEDLLRTLNRPLVAPPNEKISVLMGTNFAVDCHNQEMLHEAPGELKSYRAIDKGKN
jgi:ATP-dependent DNA helicase PIF1